MITTRVFKHKERKEYTTQIDIFDLDNYEEIDEFKELENELKKFDYTYMMSDDFKVWRSGEVEEKIVRKLVEICKENDKERTEKLIKKYKSQYGTQF